MMHGDTKLKFTNLHCVKSQDIEDP
jgi:hypothetical protein